MPDKAEPQRRGDSDPNAEVPQPSYAPEALEEQDESTSGPTGLEGLGTLAARAGRLAKAGYGPVPVLTGDKHPTAPNFQGGKSPWPSYADWHAWMEENPGFENLAARLPEGVAGVDVDAYKAEGAVSYDKIKDDLIPTVVVSPRFAMDPEPDPSHVYDGMSGIRLYRSDLTRGGMPGVDLIWNGHRYVMAPGSTHPTGRIYQAMDQRTGEYLDALPPVSDLPEMPAALRQHLEPTTPAGPTYDGPVGPAIDDSQPCRYMVKMAERFQAIDWQGDEGSRHDQVLRITHAVMQAQGDGHRGLLPTLRAMRATWEDHLPGRAAEFERMVGRSFPVLGPVDDCTRSKHQDAHDEIIEALAEVGVTAAGAADVGGGDDGDATFWASRAWLRWCRDTGRQVALDPWALFGCGLGWAAASISPDVTANVGRGPISLNQFVMLVGVTSSGKSQSFNTVEDWYPWDLVPTGVGSAEGVAKAFVRPVRKRRTPDEDEAPVPTTEQYAYRRIMFEDEWARLVGVKNQRGGGVDSVIRTAWNAGHLGQQNRADDTTLPVKRHSYRLVIVAGSQDDPAMDLLTDEASGLGTSQRWLFLRVRKIDERPAGGGIEPFPLGVPSRFLNNGVYPKEGVAISPEVVTLFEEHHRLEVDEDTAHQALRVIKIAIIMALMEGRTVVMSEDWSLASYVDARSQRLKQSLRAEHAARGRDSKKHRRVEDVAIEAEAQEEVQDARAVKHARAMWQTVSLHRSDQRHGKDDPRCTRRCVTKKVVGDEADRALGVAEQYGWLIITEETTEDAVKGKQPVEYLEPGPSAPAT